MDRSKVKEIVDAHINEYKNLFGIDHWRVEVDYDLRNDRTEIGWTAGTCTKLVDFEEAGISFDVEAMEDECQVLRVLRHELFHIVLAPFDILTNALLPVVEKDDVLCRMCEKIRQHAVEKAVINLERMYRGLSGHGDGPAADDVHRGGHFPVEG